MAFVNKDDPSIQEAFQWFFQKKNVEEQCTTQSLNQLHDAFLAAENKEMDFLQLYDAFQNILQIKMPQNEFKVIFNRINKKYHGKVTWDEFISNLLIQFQAKESFLEMEMLEPPLTDLPRLLKTRHRTPVCRIIFYPEVLPDRSTTFGRGRYLTISKDGLINYWLLDLEYERTVQSKNPYLKVQSTAITDMIVLPDIEMVCTSSTECDLRFYDAAARKFDLRVLISSLKNAVVCMYYYFSTDITEVSYIILGDMGGSVIIMSFNPMDRGPFKQQTTRDTFVLRYSDAVKGELQGLQIMEFKNIHKNWVTQVAYYKTLRAFISSSQCSDCSLYIRDLTIAKTQYKFKIPMGISCFAFCEESCTLVTGGPDCIVRLWNPFVPKKANVIFQGHRSNICALVIINAGKRIYSLSKDRCIKVWDIPSQNCIQTYNSLPSELSEYNPMTIIFNTLTRTMIIASAMIAILVCEQVINEEISDGYTHNKGVSCVLYNQLFQVIISTGLDSCIIVWDPWSGRRLRIILNAHTIIRCGEYVNIEITAACFNDSEQFLLTGARNGLLKIWDFNTGTCIRNMLVDYECEITSVVWFENRILCCGWNKRVTELATSESDMYKKDWMTNHTDDILCSAMRFPHMLATATYNGELILWRLETGQPFRKYQVIDVSRRYAVMKGTNMEKTPEKLIKIDESINQQKGKLTPCIHQESALNIIRTVAVRAMTFLTAREAKSNVGTLLVALDSGLVQVWSHHPEAGFLGAFSIIHTVGDCATALATDSENHFLITGHSIGYIKVWLLSNYMLPDPPKVCMPLLRLEFPFLWKDRIEGRAKRAVRNQTLPLLLSSVRCHTQAITSLQIIINARIIVSGSVDRTVRLWSLGGRYITTLSTFREWGPILPTVPIQKYFETYRLPADIKTIASFTTMKVLNGGMRQVQIETEQEDDISKEVLEENRNVLYKKELDHLILENYYKSQLPSKTYQEKLKLDNTLQYIPIYTHLLTYSLKPI